MKTIQESRISLPQKNCKRKEKFNAHNEKFFHAFACSFIERKKKSFSNTIILCVQIYKFDLCQIQYKSLLIKPANLHTQKQTLKTLFSNTYTQSGYSEGYFSTFHTQIHTHTPAHDIHTCIMAITDKLRHVQTHIVIDNQAQSRHG